MIIETISFRGGFDPETDLARLLMHCNNYEFSDLHMQSGWPIIMTAQGRKYVITDRKMRSSELEGIINKLYGYNNGASLINKGTPVDTDYDFKPERGVRFRYRVNGSGVVVNGSLGIAIVVRRLMAEPPHKSTIGLTDDVIKMFTGYDNGVAIISGSTGTGKSTTLASVIRDCLESDEGKIILTAESPIEYVYDSIMEEALRGKEPGMIMSSSIPLNFKSFSDAGVAALRRAPDILLIGEARDSETIDALIEGSNTGHMVWATAHSNGAPMTLRRLVQKYSPDIQETKMGDLAESLRMIMSQTLVKTTNGKVMALREVLPFNHEVRDAVMSSSAKEVYAVAREMMIKHGTPMIIEGQAAYDKGLIDGNEIDRIIRTYGSA